MARSSPKRAGARAGGGLAGSPGSGGWVGRPRNDEIWGGTQVAGQQAPEEEHRRKERVELARVAGLSPG
jgi:hypothetical protein